jgi:hypothetical protein
MACGFAAEGAFAFSAVFVCDKWLAIMNLNIFWWLLL